MVYKGSKVIERKLIRTGGIVAKGYQFESARSMEESEAYLKEVMDCITHGNRIREAGKKAIAFFYGFMGPHYVPGLDIFILRKDSENTPNPMWHSATIEDFAEQDRLKDGTLCTAEGIVLGRELELLVNDRNSWLKTWPELAPEFIVK